MSKLLTQDDKNTRLIFA